MKHRISKHRLEELFPDLEQARDSARKVKARKLLVRVIAITAIGLVVMANINFEASSTLSSPQVVSETHSELEELRRTLINFDELRNQAIEYRDVGLIHEYAENLSPVFMEDSKLIRSLIGSNIQISDVEYDIENIEVLSLRRSGTSEYVRLLVQDSRSPYKETVDGVITIIPARASASWNVELFRNSKNDKWTLWSIQTVTKPQPQ